MKPDFKVIRRDLNEAIEGVMKKHNITLDTRYNIGHDSVGFEINKLKFLYTGTGTPEEAFEKQEKDTFERYAPMFGLDVSLYGKSFNLRNETFTISGINPKARAKPVKIKNKKGEVYVTTASTINSIKEFN